MLVPVAVYNALIMFILFFYYCEVFQIIPKDHVAAHLRESLEVLLEVLTGLFDYYFEVKFFLRRFSLKKSYYNL